MNNLTKLFEIYGDGAVDQRGRYTAALDAFRALYGPGPVQIFRAPGRVNLIGEHTDYNHGYVMPAALDKDVLLLAHPRRDGEIHLANMEADFPSQAFRIEANIEPAPNGDWSNYARGAAQEAARTFAGLLHGFDGLVSSAPPLGVPRGAGVSSSSALTVVMAVALAHFAEWNPSPARMAQFCSDAEWYVGTRGGIMDQFIALLGQRDHALFLDCRPVDGDFRTETIPLPEEYRLLVVNSGVHHSNVRNEFNARVASCRAGVALLRREFPAITHLRDVESFGWTLLEPLLPEETTVATLRADGHDLGDLPNVAANTLLRVRACCRHVWSENRRVLAAVKAMRMGQIEQLGILLNEAHASARDNYRISVPELEILVEAASEIAGCVGARLTGAGWGGCIVALVHKDGVNEFQRRVPQIYREKSGRQAGVFLCQASPGAGMVGEFTV
ncbi:MAG: galactokinase [Caldilineaceae bacterium]|nr:galactokinase [Caldilineaceae bacterium]